MTATAIDEALQEAIERSHHQRQQHHLPRLGHLLRAPFNPKVRINNSMHLSQVRDALSEDN